MSARLTRAEQAERNRALLLTAARRVFLKRGYHGASVEQIADEAGFSTGVVYSQFGGKADVFFALLDARIAERAADNTRAVEGLAGDEGIARLCLRTLRSSTGLSRSGGCWSSTSGSTPYAIPSWPAATRSPTSAPWPARSGRLLVAIDTGVRLEEAAAPGSSPMTLLAGLITHLISHERAGAIAAPGREGGR
jgi:AcrR family transcriptional regulator